MPDDKPKHPGGRPRIWSNCLDLAAQCELYIESCWEDVTYTKGKGENATTWTVREQVRPYTMSGLANTLNIDRKTLLNYQKRDEYFHTIKKYRSICEEYAEQQLFTGKQAAGPIFCLKNNYEDWRDKREHELSGKGGGPIETKAEMSIEEATRLYLEGLK